MSGGLDYDPDTTGGFDRTTSNDSEGLDGDSLASDGENYVMDTPNHWRGVSPRDALGKWLTEEKPDTDVDDDLNNDPETRYDDVNGHEPFESDNDDPHDPGRNRRMGWTTY